MSILPKLSVPKYSLIIPSTKERVSYRPYLVREEKILMIASESEDSDQIQTALIDLVAECLDYKGDVNKLTNCDLEYIFLQLRGKSVGDKIDILKTCVECDASNDVTIDISTVTVIDHSPKDGIIRLSDDLSLELNYPTLGNKIDYNSNDSDTEVLIKSVATALAVVYYGEETYNAADTPIEERIEFVEGFSNAQFQQAVDYLLMAPYVEYSSEFTCSKCGHKEKFSYTGIIDFFI